MTIYKCMNDLIGKKLMCRDLIIFDDGKIRIEGKISNTHLSCNHYANSTPFKMIGLTTRPEILKFCSKYYGYTVKHGTWPSCNYNDYPALQRMIMAIYGILEKNFSWRNRYDKT